MYDIRCTMYDVRCTMYESPRIENHSGSQKCVHRTSNIVHIFILLTFTFMQRIRPDVDIIKDLLEAVLEAQPLSSFAQSLLKQYHERGGLSKKQLEGLYSKASKIKDMPVNKLATLEAIILKRPNRYKSSLPVSEPLYAKDETAGQMIETILKRYPQHKRVLFLRAKYDNNDVLAASEIAELQKFMNLLK